MRAEDAGLAQEQGTSVSLAFAGDLTGKAAQGYGRELIDPEALRVKLHGRTSGCALKGARGESLRDGYLPIQGVGRAQRGVVARFPLEAVCEALVSGGVVVNEHATCDRDLDPGLSGQRPGLRVSAGLRTALRLPGDALAGLHLLLQILLRRRLSLRHQRLRGPVNVLLLDHAVGLRVLTIGKSGGVFNNNTCYTTRFDNIKNRNISCYTGFNSKSYNSDTGRWDSRDYNGFMP